MSDVPPVVIFVALLAVPAVLLVGVSSMMKGGEFNRKYGNKLMRLRVVLHLLAIVLFALVILATSDRREAWSS